MAKKPVYSIHADVRRKVHIADCHGCDMHEELTTSEEVLEFTDRHRRCRLPSRNMAASLLRRARQETG